MQLPYFIILYILKKNKKNKKEEEAKHQVLSVEW
jgi:hypothetical protein